MDIKMIIKMLSKRKELQVHEHWTRKQLEEYQVQALKRLREYAYVNSSFYKKYHKGLYNAPLDELPVISKAMLMEHFDEVITDSAIHLEDVKKYMNSPHENKQFLDKYWVNSTSGSSGKPGVFITSREEWINTLASGMRGFEGAGIKMRLTGRIKMAQITTTNASHMSAQGGKSMGNWWMPIMLLSASEPIKSIVEKLNLYRPNAIIGYASMIRILAEEQLSGRLKISPHTIISGSEVLTQETRRYAVKAWGNVLFNMYGTTDCGGIGGECSHHKGMHLMEDLSIIEVVDKNNRPVPDGEYGHKLLVTVLGNYTQPLIRYELEDSIRISKEACSCGRPFKLIDDIQGRVHEVLSFAGINGGDVSIHPILFHNIIDQLPVNGWQVVQESDGLYILLGGVNGKIDEEKMVDELKRALGKQNAVIPKIEVKKVAEIPQAASGKTPLVKSNLIRV